MRNVLLDIKIQLKPAIITEKGTSTGFRLAFLCMRTEYVIKCHKPMRRKWIIQKYSYFFSQELDKLEHMMQHHTPYF